MFKNQSANNSRWNATNNGRHGHYSQPLEYQALMSHQSGALLLSSCSNYVNQSDAQSVNFEQNTTATVIENFFQVLL
jgi:hypothetical protein